MLNKDKLIAGLSVFVVLIAVLALYSAINSIVNPEPDTNVEEEEKSTLKRGLEIGLVILVIILVILGLIVGFKRLQEVEAEEKKKKYLRIAGKNKDEYKLEYGDSVYYIRKKDLK